MRASVDNLKVFARADLDFHHALAAGADNPTINDLPHVVRSLLQVYARRAVHDREHAQRAIDEHDAVYRALVERNPDRAASAMAVHMATAAERIAASAEPPGPQP